MEASPTAARAVEDEEPEFRHLKRPPTDDYLDFVAFVVANVSLFGKHARPKMWTPTEAEHGQRSRDPTRDDSDYGDDDHLRFGSRLEDAMRLVESMCAG
jgi:hypothetical protein